MEGQLRMAFLSSLVILMNFWEILLQDTIIFWRLPKHTLRLCLCQLRGTLCVFWQMCHEIVMAPSKDTIGRCVPANTKKKWHPVANFPKTSQTVKS
jgi:hypothetical protein